MKNITLFSHYLRGGCSVGVLVSYMFLYYQGLFHYCTICMLHLNGDYGLFHSSCSSSVVSVLAVINFTFGIGCKELDENYRTLFIVSLSIFFTVAMLWSLVACINTKQKKFPSFKKPILYIVGLASIGMLFYSE